MSICRENACLGLAVVVVLLLELPPSSSFPARSTGWNSENVTGEIFIDTTRPTFVVNDLFLSLGMDVNLVRNRWLTFNFSSERALTLARGLAPAYLRFSGTDADFMIFDQKEEKEVNSYFPATNFTMTKQDWDRINTFAIRAEWRMLFGLNAQLRSGDEWDSSNARELLDYSIDRGYSHNLDFELGNEPDLYDTKRHQVLINGTRLGQDVHILRKLLDSPIYAKYYKNSVIVGPDIANPSNEKYITDFVNAAGDSIVGVTWHQYYGSGASLHHVDNYTDPDVLDSYIPKVKSVADAIKQSRYPYHRSWQGETSSVVRPAPPWGICQSYVAGFMLIDKLGLSARMRVSLVVRQTFYGFMFGLINEALRPTPNYWITYIFKNLVGNEVLGTEVFVLSSKANAVRFYAHCTPQAARYPSGAVTLYGMNLLDTTAILRLSHQLDVDQFLLTPGGWGGITSGLISVNGQVLMMPDDNSLPQIKPKPLSNEEFLTLPSKTMGFYVLKNVKAEACRKTK